MPIPDQLVLVRHGESARNRAKAGHVFLPDGAARDAFLNTSDQSTELTDEGWQQSRRAGVDLRRRFGAFDLVVHSGYRRTRDTTSAILEAWSAETRPVDVREHLLLRERDTGYAVNMTRDESAEAFPWLQEYWQSTGPFIARPPGGESMADVSQRVQLFLTGQADLLAGRRVLIVSHVGTIRMFRRLLENWDYEETERHLRGIGIPNCGVVAYRADSLTGRLTLET